MINKLCVLKRNEQLVYHVGQLAYDRGSGNDYTLDRVATAAMRLAEEGRVNLVQRIVYSSYHPFRGYDHEYIAVGA